jgi:type I restriction enzyme R subunit
LFLVDRRALAAQAIRTFHSFDAGRCQKFHTTAEASLWRRTLAHFDLIRVGLTATPAAHTKAHFDDVAFR